MDNPLQCMAAPRTKLDAERPGHIMIEQPENGQNITLKVGYQAEALHRACASHMPMLVALKQARDAVTTARTLLTKNDAASNHLWVGGYDSVIAAITDAIKAGEGLNYANS